ncbi:hypothetical protein [Yeosuana marina]|uniref:hypothetical protein n=1 Tax=Yeosuana marina TaxID=1565536 RepID=UPI00142460E0|nr:hypothetical protein [Yeosuana marina]
MTLLLIVIGIMAIIVLVFSLISFDDEDPDMDWYDNYAVLECPHLNKSLVTVSSSVNCETVHTVCDDCSKVLKVEHDCR